MWDATSVRGMVQRERNDARSKMPPALVHVIKQVKMKDLTPDSTRTGIG